MPCSYNRDNMIKSLSGKGLGFILNTSTMLLGVDPGMHEWLLNFLTERWQTELVSSHLKQSLSAQAHHKGVCWALHCLCCWRTTVLLVSTPTTLYNLLTTPQLSASSPAMMSLPIKKLEQQTASCIICNRALNTMKTKEADFKMTGHRHHLPLTIRGSEGAQAASFCGGLSVQQESSVITP